MKKITLIICLFAVQLVLGIKPTEINVSNDGILNTLYFNLENKQTIAPLYGLELDGRGNVMLLEILIGNGIVQFDQFGQTQGGVLQGPFKVQYNYQNKIEKIKDYNNRLIIKLEYDYSGKLVKIKDANYNLKFKLNYNYDGRLDALLNGDYDKLIRLSYDYNKNISGIRNQNFDYVYRFYYNRNNRISHIKSSAYELLAKFIYQNTFIQHVEQYNIPSQIYIGHQNIRRPGHRKSRNYIAHSPYNQQNVVFFTDVHFSGQNFVVSLGNYDNLNGGWNDQISSIKVPPGFKILVYEHSNFRGACKEIRCDWTSGGYYDYWNNRISSFKIVRM